MFPDGQIMGPAVTTSSISHTANVSSPISWLTHIFFYLSDYTKLMLMAAVNENTMCGLCGHLTKVKKWNWGPILDSPQQGCRSGSRRPSRAEGWTAPSWRARGCCPTAPAGSPSPAGNHPSTQPVSGLTGETNRAAGDYMSQKARSAGRNWDTAAGKCTENKNRMWLRTEE